MSDEFDIVYNFLTENRYPEGFSKDKKRKFRRKVNLCSYLCKCMYVKIRHFYQVNNNFKCEDGVLYFRTYSRIVVETSRVLWRVCIHTEEEKKRILEACDCSTEGMSCREK